MYVEIMRLSYSAKVIEITKWVDEICKLSRERQKNFISYAFTDVQGELYPELNER